MKLVLLLFPFFCLAYSPTEFQISFNAYIDRSVSDISSRSSDLEAIDNQLKYLVSTLSLGAHDFLGKPPWGFRSIINKDYRVDVIRVSSSPRYRRIHYRFQGILLAEHSNEFLCKELLITLPINLETIFQRSLNRDGSTFCARFNLAQYFYANWRPWRSGCQLEKDVDYLQAEIVIGKRYDQKSLDDTWVVQSNRKVMSLFVWDMNDGVEDDSDQTYQLI